MKSNIVIILLFGILWCSCKSSDPASTIGSGGDIVPGDFRGAVTLYDSVGNLLQDKSGVLVELVGTQYSTTTDSAGLWVFHNLPTRTYALRFSKASFVTRNDQFTYVGGGTVWYSSPVGYLVLRQPPVFHFVFDAVVAPDSTNGKFYFHMSGTPPSNGVYGVVLVATITPGPSLDDSSIRVSTAHSRNTLVQEGTSNSFSMTNDVRSAISYYYGHNVTVYFRLFPYIGYSAEFDVDPVTQQERYVNCGTGSNVLSVVVP